MELQFGAPDRVAPYRSQGPQHRLGVSHAAQHPNDAAHQRQRGALGQQQTPHLSWRQTECQQYPDLRSPLFEPELKQQRHQQQRRRDQEEAEAEEQLPEVLPLRRSRERLITRRFEPQTDVARADNTKKGLFQSQPKLFGRDSGRNRKTYRRDISESTSPHALPGG